VKLAEKQADDIVDDAKRRLARHGSRWRTGRIRSCRRSR
jgi:hypothetical protein